LRLVATKLSLPIPAKRREGGTWTRDNLRSYIAENVVRDRTRWSFGELPPTMEEAAIRERRREGIAAGLTPHHADAFARSGLSVEEYKAAGLSLTEAMDFTKSGKSWADWRGAVPNGEHASGNDAPQPVSDRRITEADVRVTAARERLAKAQARVDAATGQTAEERGLAEYFPLGVGGGGGGRKGATDARLAKAAQAFRDRDRAQVDVRVAEMRAARLRDERDAAGKYGPDSVKPGDAIKVKGTWERVLKANDKTVQVDAGRGLDVRYRWDQVTDHRSAESVISVAADRAGLTGTERADFIAWAKRNPGKTVADWRTQRAA
jgi:hypothetical protein